MKLNNKSTFQNQNSDTEGFITTFDGLTGYFSQQRTMKQRTGAERKSSTRECLDEQSNSLNKIQTNAWQLPIRIKISNVRTERVVDIMSFDNETTF